MKDLLLAKGMINAQNAILSGCSAGGLASILKHISDASHIEEFFAQVVATHGSIKHLPASCTKRLNPAGLISHILVPDDADPNSSWESCKNDTKTCSPYQLQTLQGFRVQFLNALAGLGNSSSRGMFIDSCYIHCLTVYQETWLRADSPVLDKTAAAMKIFIATITIFLLSLISSSRAKTESEYRESDGVYLGYRWSRRVYDSREDFDKFKDKIIVKINDTSFYRSNEENKAWEEIPSDY
ncbi:hypothetical protein WN943_026209 [Citrus x changshan-huyou]